MAETAEEGVALAAAGHQAAVESLLGPLAGVLRTVATQQSELAVSLRESQAMLAEVSEEELVAAASTFAKLPAYTAKLRALTAATKQIAERAQSVRARAERGMHTGEVELRAAVERQKRARERDDRLRAAGGAEPASPAPAPGARKDA
eukprot:Hpha_TRINITY_DN35839_c0_g1::TRINITY_DN35839_c0_g1_i1::g.84922::m.84922